jgi:hypothetical protein
VLFIIDAFTPRQSLRRRRHADVQSPGGGRARRGSSRPAPSRPPRPCVYSLTHRPGPGSLVKAIFNFHSERDPRRLDPEPHDGGGRRRGARRRSGLARQFGWLIPAESARVAGARLTIEHHIDAYDAADSRL